LSVGDEILATADGSGSPQSIMIESQLPMTLVHLTATKQDCYREEDDILVIFPEEAYLILDAYEVMSGDDDVISGGESTSISLNVENLGMEDAEETVMTIGCYDEYVTMESTSLDLGLIPAQTLMEFDELINFEVSEDIPFGHPIRMDLEFTSLDGSWLEELNLSAYAPPGLWIDPGVIEAEVESTDIYTTTFTISNYLDDPVEYSIRTESDDRGRNLTGCYVECDHHHFEPGEQYQWIVTANNLSADGEWITDVSVALPEGVYVENTGQMLGGSGVMEPDITSGDGITITWHGATPSGFGYLHEGQSAEAELVITVDDAYTGYIVCDYEMVGDNYGGDPHVINGSFELSYPLSWISLDNTEGEIEYGQTDFIEVSLDPAGLEVGIYECEIVITDSRLETRIPVTMEITESIIINYGDIDDNGEVEAFDASLVLQYSVGIDPAPYAPLPWEDWRLLRSDVDGNDFTEAYDASLILQYSVGIINTFPFENRNAIIAPKAEINYLISRDGIEITSNNDIYSLYIATHDNNILGTPLYDNSEMMFAFNNDKTWQTAAASALPNRGKLLDIPLNTRDIQEDLKFDIWINGVYSSLIIRKDELLTALIPSVTRLTGNYPNPFNPSTTIKYDLAVDSHIRLDIFNIKGQHITSLVNEYQTAGEYKVQWQGISDNNTSIPSGIFFYKLSAEGITDTRKMIMLK
ncbi:MAG: T9SS type A sorting domain-containing protein, partial [Candidatus Stygibacter frigidus]|nr:T9SS type A sorting domain-containing protein [Candidatus Stygibacter frigidus]